MSKFENFMIALKLEKLSHHTQPESFEELRNTVEEICSTQFDSRSGMYVMDDLVEIAKSMDMEPNRELVVEAAADYLLSQKDDPKLYETMRDFLFKFAKNGPELYERLEAGNITPEKQWEIDLKKRENYILEGNENEDRVKVELIQKLSETQTPLSLNDVKGLGPVSIDIINDVKEMMLIATEDLVKEGLDRSQIVPVLEKAMESPEIIGFTIKQNEFGQYELHGTGMLEGFVTTAINAHDIDMSRLAYVADNAMTRFKYSGDIADTMNLSKKQVELTLDSYIKIAQRYQGEVRLKERERLPDMEEKPLNPPYMSMNKYKEEVYNKPINKEDERFPDKEFNEEEELNEYFRESEDVLNEIPQIKGDYIENPSGPYVTTPVGPIIETPDIEEIGTDFDLDEISLPRIKPPADGTIVMQNDEQGLER